MQPLSKLPLFGFAQGDHAAAFKPPPAPAPVPIYPPRGAGFKGERDGPSETAAKAVSTGSAKMRARVLRELMEAEAEQGPGFVGLVAYEVAARLDLHPLMVQPRISELHKLGLVVKGKTLGKSELGNPATRWRIRQGDAPLVPNQGGSR